MPVNEYSRPGIALSEVNGVVVHYTGNPGSNQRNDDTISIECCHSDDTGQFSQDTLDALVQLLKWLIKTYELGRDDILRHYDVIGKECPYYFVKHPDAWEELLNSLAYGNAF